MNSAVADRRRGWLAVAATAAVALAAGAGVAWWPLRPTPGAAVATTFLFEQSFDDPDGRAQPLSQWRGKVLVVNFWATWCPPCVEEMPDLQRVRDAYAERGVEIIGVGIDSAQKIREFRDRLGIRLPLLVAGAGGSALARELGNAAGALPYTVLVTPAGQVAQRKLGQIKPDELRRWIEAQL
jgi:thiol-disulfide isomerase/thioredoxin